MDPRCEDDGLTLGNVDGVAEEIGNDEHVDIVACEGLAEDGLADLVLVLKGAHLANELTLVRVGERVAVGKEHRVVVIYTQVPQVGKIKVEDT